MTRQSFLSFIRSRGITTTMIADDDAAIDEAVTMARATVLTQLPAPFYELAANNFAADYLLNHSLSLFNEFNKAFHLDKPFAGIINNGSDTGTSASWELPEWAQKMNINELQQYKTPFGREYLGIMQRYGSPMVKV